MATALRRTYDGRRSRSSWSRSATAAVTAKFSATVTPTLGRVSNVIPVDVEVGGCPPSPERLLQAILTAVSGGAPSAVTPSSAALTGGGKIDAG